MSGYDDGITETLAEMLVSVRVRDARVSVMEQQQGRDLPDTSIVGGMGDTGSVKGKARRTAFEIIQAPVLIPSYPHRDGRWIIHLGLRRLHLHRPRPSPQQSLKTSERNSHLTPTRKPLSLGKLV